MRGFSIASVAMRNSQGILQQFFGAFTQRFGPKFWSRFGLVLAGTLAVMVVKSFIVDFRLVPSASMVPTLQPGDFALINLLAYDFHAPARGDLVAFVSRDGGQRLVKRVIGLPGDLIEVRNDRVWINHVPCKYQQETQSRCWLELLPDGGSAHQMTLAARPGMLANRGEVRVPNNAFFVMGDNRDESCDSRFFGPVDRQQIFGRVCGVPISFARGIVPIMGGSAHLSYQNPG
jgi:signal peptidase I